MKKLLSLLPLRRYSVLAVLSTLLCVFTLGCSVTSEKFGPVVKAGVANYCVANEMARAQIRSNWSRALAPYAIRVICPADLTLNKSSLSLATEPADSGGTLPGKIVEGGSLYCASDFSICFEADTSERDFMKSQAPPDYMNSASYLSP